MTLGYFLGLLLASALLVAVPGMCLLAKGNYRRDRHWTEKARIVTVVRALVVAQMLLLPILALVTTAWLAPGLLSRLSVLGTALLGWYGGTRVLDWRLARGHDFPRPVVALETERHILYQVVCFGALVSPLVTLGLSFTVRLTASALAAAAWLVLRFASFHVMRLFGLIEAMPEEAAGAVAHAAPSARVAVWRTAMPNALAYPAEERILVTTGLLQVLTNDELEAVLAHEAAHLREKRSMGIARELPGLALVAGGIAVSMAQTDWGLCVAFAAIAIVTGTTQSPSRRSRRSRRRERKADRAAIEHIGDGESYARALVALHRAFLVPATIGRKEPHLSLFDRMLAAGLTPDFERPAPPPSSPVMYVFILLLTALTLHLLAQSLL
jgi:Zn-dependent protease with chaperone function